MSNPFFDHPILNSPYDCPQRHWELDADGQPTQQILPTRRRAEFITPIPKPKKRRLCRVAESHPRVLTYVKNHNTGLDVPYRFGSVMRKYLPDFIVLVDDGHGPTGPLHLVVEIKGYRGEEAIEKKSTMDTYWVPGVNHLGQYGRWAFAEFTEVYQIESDFKAKIEGEFNKMIESLSSE